MFNISGYELLHGFSLTALFIIMLIFAKMLNDWMTPYHVEEELVVKDNSALAISFGGYLLATAIVFVGALLGPSKGILLDLVTVGGYTLFGIILLNAARWINDKLIFYKFCNVKEIVEDKNSGTGAVQFGSYIASGLIIAGAIHGEGGGLLTSVVFFALGQVALIIFSWIYNFITPFDIHDEIEKDNVAAGVAFSGALIAIGIILMKGASGNFINWKTNLSIFGLDALLILVLLPCIRFFFDKMIIPRSDLNHEIAKDKNLGAAFLEAVMMIGFSIVLLTTLG